MRLLASLSFSLGLAALTLPVPHANAQTPENAVKTAFDLCTNVPGQIDEARAILSEAHWKESESAALTTLYWLTVATNFKADDLDFTFRNAAFMAASVLGNSALGQDQIGVEFDNYMLALLGLPEGTPYCVMTGPDDLLLNFARSKGELQQQMSQSSPTLIQTQGIMDETFAVSFGGFDLDAVSSLLARSSLSDAFQAEIRAFFVPSVLHIANVENFQ
ncbi:MAG: hypothetical protein AAGF13_10545 [Pseudomonadota bacterium]